MLIRQGAVVLLAGLLVAVGREAGTGSRDVAPPVREAPRVVSAEDGAVTVSPTDSATLSAWEHRYRVSGKVRLLLFWAGASDVGGARMRVVQGAGARDISFFGGSDPARAPRRLNMWGYAVEHASPQSGRVFMLRRMGEPDPASVEASLADGGADALFGAACGAIDGAGSLSSITGVRVDPSMTYRAFDRVLSAVGASSRWRLETARYDTRTYPGFFSALQDTMADAIGALRAGAPLPRAARKIYLYKGLPYELRVLRMEQRTSAVVRAQYRYVNPQTGDTGDFVVVFGAAGPLAGVPLHFSVQPNWWLRLELELDDEVDVPADPGSNEAVARSIGDICDRALAQGASHRSE